MKKLLIIPILFCLFLAIINIVYGNIFAFGLWLLATTIITLALLPIFFNSNDKNVPIYQIFIILPALLLVFTIVATKDFIKAGQPVSEAFIYGTGIGIATVGAIMILKGNGK